MSGAELPCWACGEYCDKAKACPDCGAPRWIHEVTTHGVYVVRAECGLVKIGLTTTNFRARISALCSGSEHYVVLATLDGADRDVEQWLHATFHDVRDPDMARAEGLPCHTEWFWPTPALRRLIAGEEFMRAGTTWEMAGVS